MQLYCSLQLLMNLLAALNVFGGKPHTKFFISHARVEPSGELLILGAVADEARVKLYGLLKCEQRRSKSYKIIGHPAALKEAFRNSTAGLVECTEADF